MKNWERWFLPLAMLVLAAIFLPGMEPTSAKWIFLSAFAVVGAAFALFVKPVLPDMDRKAWAALAILWVGFLAHLFWFQPSGYEFSLLARFSFFAFLWCSWKGFSSDGLRWQDFWWPLTAAILVLVARAFFHVGDGLALAVALLIFWNIPSPAQVPAKIFGLVIGAVGLAGVLLFANLAAVIALGSGALLMITAEFTQKKKATWKTFLPAVAVLVGAAAIFGAVEIGQKQELHLPFMENARAERHLRRSIWRETVHFIRANPMGVGVDRFTFVFTPYFREGSPDRILNSPGNEFLRYPAEEGLPLSALYLLALGFLYFAWWKKGAAHRQVVLPFSAFLLASMFLASPGQNPFFLGFAAIVFGAMGAGIWKRRMLPGHAGTRATLIILLLAATWMLGKVAVSFALERSGEPFYAKTSCRALPSNWKACLNYSRLLLAQGDTAEARREVESVMERDPSNFVAIRHLATIALKQGDRLEACFLTWKYDDLFNGHSDLAAEYAQNCPEKWRAYFTRKRPEKYYRH